MIDSILTCAVLPDADRLVRERLTRDLSQALTEDPLLLQAHAKISYRSADNVEPGAKGAAFDVTQLVVTAAGAGSLPFIARQVVAAIQAWCSRDGRRKVRVTFGEVTVEITGKPTKSQLKIVDDALGRITSAAQEAKS